jgi:hypothetical protein
LAFPFETHTDEEDVAVETIEGASADGSVINEDVERKGVDWSQVKL